MAMTTGQFLVLCEGSLISKIHHDDLPLRPTQYQEVFKVSTLDELYLEEAQMAGFGPLQQISEGGEVSYDEAIAPIKKRWDYDTYGLAYRITKKLQDNDRFGEIMKLERDLDRSVDDTIETFAFGVLNNATSTSNAYNTGFDGLALASTAHTRLDGGATQSNFANTALSYTALQDALVAMRKTKNHRGRPNRIDPNVLYVSVDLMHTAEEILGSPMRPSTTAPGDTSTANNVNAINTLGRFGLQWKALDYLTATTFAALVAPEHDLKFVWRNKPVKKMEEEFATDNINRKVTMDVLRGFGEYRGFYLIND